MEIREKGLNCQGEKKVDLSYNISLMLPTKESKCFFRHDNFELCRPYTSQKRSTRSMLSQTTRKASGRIRFEFGHGA